MLATHRKPTSRRFQDLTGQRFGQLPKAAAEKLLKAAESFANYYTSQIERGSV